MHARPCLAVALAAAAALAGGCAAPVLTMHHVLPAALPLPADVGLVRAKDFAVDPPSGTAVWAPAARGLDERLAALWPEGGRGAVADVGGKVRIEVKDAPGSREVRRWDTKTRAWVAETVPTLVRTATVGVDFVATRGDVRLLAVECRRTYHSAEDPRVRGDLGLERPDDPARVPAADQVVRELLDECVASFCEMIAPGEVTVHVPTRGTLNGDGAAGLKAAAGGDFQAAVRHLEAAVAASPNDVDLLFDLAVACEAAGRLDVALAHYRAVTERTGGKDRLAVDSAARTERVLKRL
ncbi:MAG: tetratricopeptide repeat protein, partial [Planctomycetes bacterium]|nr:tetratricopeptide repeat protein [Planctomycetota bacterium]